MEFSRWSQGFPGLLWLAEHKRSRMKMLNAWEMPQQGVDTARLLKDAQYRRRMVLKSDHSLLVEFWEMMASRQPAAVTFRLKKDSRFVYRLQGWPHPDDPERYFGLLMEAALPVTFVTDGESRTCQLALGLVQYPVIVVDVRHREIVTCNDAAQDVFGGVGRRGEDFLLEDIAPGEFGETLIRAASHALDEEVWAGTLMLRSGSGCMLGFKVRISPCSSQGGIVRVAMLNVPESPAFCDFSPNMAEYLEGFSLKSELEQMLQRCPDVEGIMFSRFHAAQGIVESYGVGRLFSSLEWGISHAYEGTVAQDMERFSLEAVFVEDTLDSIKSIDWAMFIPCGVRSYFAKPFYSAEGLNSLLIFASGRPGDTAVLSEERLRPLYGAFAQSVAFWRDKKGRR
ncbi:hypothetical protein [Mailhella sp.]|uniref:hypothetical protein n=1 Tax=Mailhella sp. TaxID=1981029 RepID=UPI004062E7C2